MLNAPAVYVVGLTKPICWAYMRMMKSIMPRTTLYRFNGVPIARLELSLAMPTGCSRQVHPFRSMQACRSHMLASKSGRPGRRSDEGKGRGALAGMGTEATASAAGSGRKCSEEGRRRPAASVLLVLGPLLAWRVNRSHRADASSAVVAVRTGSAGPSGVTSGASLRPKGHVDT